LPEYDIYKGLFFIVWGVVRPDGLLPNINGSHEKVRFKMRYSRIFTPMAAALMVLFAVGISAAQSSTSVADDAVADKAIVDSGAASKAAPKQNEAATAATPTDTVATVNGVKISSGLLDKVYQQTVLGQQQGAEAPVSKKDILEKLVEINVVSQAAEKDGMQNDPDFVLGMDMIRKQQLYVAYMRKKVIESVKVTPEEVKDYYDKNKAEFQAGEEVRASHILVDSEDEAKKIKARLDKGADFAAVAKDKSKCPSAPRGGDLGFFGRGKMVPEFEKAAFALKTGEVSAPVKTQFGWHIIKVTDRKDSRTKTLDEVKSVIEQRLLQEKQKKTYDSTLTGLKAAADIKINETALSETKAAPAPGESKGDAAAPDAKKAEPNTK